MIHLKLNGNAGLHAIRRETCLPCTLSHELGNIHMGFIPFLLFDPALLSMTERKQALEDSFNIKH